MLYIPSRHSPGMAPSGCRAVTIYTVAPNVIRGAAWDERREQYADHLVACAERHVPGLAAATKTRVIVTPLDFRRRVRQEQHSFGGGVLGVMKGARAAVKEMRAS